MIERFQAVSNYIGLVGLLTQLVFIFLQLRLYQTTGHRSALWLAASTALGICYMAVIFSPRLLGLSVETHLYVDMVAAAIETIQSALGIAGVVMLFRAFEDALARGRAS